jgi:hypothetical protein
LFVNFTISDIQKNESGSEVFKRLWIARVDGNLSRLAWSAQVACQDGGEIDAVLTASYTPATETTEEMKMRRRCTC